jgi:two-component system OmpR family response regulator
VAWYGAAKRRFVRILVIEDQREIAAAIRAMLERRKYAVDVASDGDSGFEMLLRGTYDAAIIDVVLPGRDGFAICRDARAEGVATPVLFLTARDAVEDRVRGLTLGADDYMTKPFSLEELVARVRSVLRRTADAEVSSHQLSFADLELDEETREVRRGGRPIALSPTEFALLRYLLLNARRVLSKAQILDHVWQYDFGGDGRIVETYISYLRKKVDGDGPALIHTRRGVGYSLRMPEE